MEKEIYEKWIEELCEEIKKKSPKNQISYKRLIAVIEIIDVLNNNEELQDSIIEKAPHLVGVLKNIVTIHPKILEKYKDLFESEELGLL